MHRSFDHDQGQCHDAKRKDASHGWDCLHAAHSSKSSRIKSIGIIVQLTYDSAVRNPAQSLPISQHCGPQWVWLSRCPLRLHLKQLGEPGGESCRQSRETKAICARGITHSFLSPRRRLCRHAPRELSFAMVAIETCLLAPMV